MKKVGEHVTMDFLGVKQDYSPDFYTYHIVREHLGCPAYQCK